MQAIGLARHLEENGIGRYYWLHNHIVYNITKYEKADNATALRVTKTL